MDHLLKILYSLHRHCEDLHLQCAVWQLFYVCVLSYYVQEVSGESSYSGQLHVQ